MSLYRTIYTSRPFGFDKSVLGGILMDARRANVRNDITGALICRADIYIQWLEGPEEQVRELLARIEQDDRHLEVKVHVAENVGARKFGDWAMDDLATIDPEEPSPRPIGSDASATARDAGMPQPAPFVAPDAAVAAPRSPRSR